jgi:hypothetical protein
MLIYILKHIYHKDAGKMSSNKPYTKFSLPNGIEAELLEPRGIHYLNAMAVSGGNKNEIMISFVTQLVKINGKLVTRIELEEMDMPSCMAIVDAVSLLLN